MRLLRTGIAGGRLQKEILGVLAGHGGRDLSTKLAVGALGLVAGAYAVKRLRRAQTDRLEGRVVLITGGSRGLGLLLAREFGLAGARLAICARDAEELDRARLGLERRGHEIYATTCDVANPTEVHALIDKVLTRYGRLDVLVNNAGVIQVGALASLRLEDFREAMAINFWGTVHTTLAALDALKSAKNARLVNICSIGGKIAMPHLLPYDCAKFAVIGFSEGLRAELASDGVSVTTVVPGLMRTGSHASATFKGDPSSEYQWFRALAQASSATLDGRAAARRIVRATLHREAEVVLGWQARLAATAKTWMPGLVRRVLARANRFLPRGHEGAGPGVAGRSLALASNRDRWS